MWEFRDIDGNVEKMPKIAKKWSEKSTCGPSRQQTVLKLDTNMCHGIRKRSAKNEGIRMWEFRENGGSVEKLLKIATNVCRSGTSMEQIVSKLDIHVPNTLVHHNTEKQGMQISRFRDIAGNVKNLIKITFRFLFIYYEKYINNLYNIQKNRKLKIYKQFV